MGDRARPPSRRRSRRGRRTNQPCQLLGLFRIEGDFEIAADLSIDSLPRPTRDKKGKGTMDPSNNVEVGLFGPGWMVTAYRCNSEAKGDAVGFYANTPAGESKSASFVVPPKRGKDVRIELRRTGDVLTISHGTSSAAKGGRSRRPGRSVSAPAKSRS